MRKLSSRIFRCQKGAVALEFSIIGPVFIVIILAIIEIGMILHSYIRVDEALRQAVRQAVIQPAIVSTKELSTSPVDCTYLNNNTKCSGSSVINTDSFSAIYNTAQKIMPNLEPQMLTVTYSTSGFGKAATSDSTMPIVTLTVSGYLYDSLILGIIGFSIVELPEYSITRVKGV